jgi:hypothetical protein
VYLPRQCAGRAQLYAKPLEVPTVPTIDLFGRFIVFVRQLKDGIGERLNLFIKYKQFLGFVCFLDLRVSKMRKF